MRKKILILSIIGGLSLFLSNPLFAENKEKLSIEDIKIADEKSELLLPSINEIYTSAIEAKVTADWNKKVKLSKKNYKEMKPPRRAFEVGKTLSDITFLVLDKAPSNEIKNAAFHSLTSITLPPKFKLELDKFSRSADGLKGEALRKKMDSLIKVLLNSIEETKDENIRDTAMTLLAASYFKAYYLAADTVKGKDPTEEQLKLFSSPDWRDLTTYFLDYFTNTASKNYRENETLKSFLFGLSKIKSIINKSGGKMVKKDISSIYKVLKNSY